MKALTLTQPWATLVALGAKRVETRSWRTQYRGLLAIHAAKGFPKWARELCETEPFRNALMTYPPFREQGWQGLPTGAIVAFTSLCGIAQTENVAPDPTHWEPMLHVSTGRILVPPREYGFGDYSVGRYAWLLGKASVGHAPFPAKGALGLWEWEAADATP